VFCADAVSDKPSTQIAKNNFFIRLYFYFSPITMAA
jgi:hypothetical protein